MGEGRSASYGENMEDENLKELSRDESLSIPLLPSLAASGDCRVTLRRFIISPCDRRYRLWKTVLFTLALYTAWMSIFEFCFLTQLDGALLTIDNLFNGFFAVDIVVTFFVAYLDKTTDLLVDNQKLIAWKYMSTWLVFDVVSTIPVEHARNIYLKPYGLFRLLRLRRVSALFSRLEKDGRYNYFCVQCARLICVTVFAVNCSLTFQKSVWIRYVTSICWSISSLTTINCNNLDLVNIFGIFYCLFYLGFVAFLIGYFIFLVIHRRNKRFDTIPTASSLAKQDQVFVGWMLGESGGVQQEAIDSLPKVFRSVIYDYLASSLVNKFQEPEVAMNLAQQCHEAVTRLIEDGEKMSTGDVGHFVCSAAEKNNLDLLKEIARHGGDVTCPTSNGTTALHVAVSKRNVKIVRYLLDRGADIDKQDMHGQTPRDLADQQRNKGIKLLLEAHGKQQNEVHHRERSTSEPAVSGDWVPPSPIGGLLTELVSRRRNSSNSLFEVIPNGYIKKRDRLYPARIIISCPEKSEMTSNLILVPKSFQELLKIGADRFGIADATVRTKDGIKIGDIDVIRDGDHIIFVSR